MAEPIRGKLVWQGTGSNRVRRVVYPTKKGTSPPTPFDAEQLSASLRGITEDEVEVELELDRGKPVRIRPVGQPFAATLPRPAQPPSERREQRGDRPQRGGGGRPQPRDQGHPQEHRPRVRPAFHNPYNFVPAPPRKPDHPDLGDHEPAGHHRYHDSRVSGCIRVRMTLQTPLLLPDAALAREHADDNPAQGIKQGHKEFPVRLDADGKPYLPPTSIKGMLRSAYEAVTNSRLAVFAGHKDRLAYRMAANEGLSLVPARLEGEELVLLSGTSAIGNNGRPNGPMYAAWLRRYRPGEGGIHPDAIRCPDGSLPSHGEQVVCWVERIQHFQPEFQFWGVRMIARSEAELGPCPAEFQQRGQRQGKYQRLGECLRIRGYVCITNQNIDRKHDERVFFIHDQDEVRLPLTAALRQGWDELIRNYRSTHAEDLADRARRGQSPEDYLGREPGRTAWSRHVYQPGTEHLADGSLCYVTLDLKGSIEALYPVMISRKLYSVSPLQRLPRSLQPAASLQELSPADRVFGWVNQSGQGAYRGNVRVGPVACESAEAIDDFGEPGLPLAILGQPKEQQARFYVAGSLNGEAQEDGLSKDAVGYLPDKGLRGRKVYPHHRRLPAGHWEDPRADRTREPQEGSFQEYRRPRLNGQEQRDNQNRSVRGWVKPGTRFAFDLHVTNLSRVEMGALLWLLSLPVDHFHRLGGGKPLGFGSVRLDIVPEETQLYEGNGWREYYSTLDSISQQSTNQQTAIDEFKTAVVAPYGSGGGFEQVSFIAAFLRMAKGFDDSLPTHYPRARQEGQPDPVPPHPEGQAYEWFVANDRTGAQGGPRVSLPSLANDPGLPMLDAP